MSQYWNSRSKYHYYKRVDYLLDSLINNEYKDSHPSIIDIGCRDTQVIFNHRGDKTLLDIKNFYRELECQRIDELGITFIESSIYDYTPNTTYDIALCLQTLEHLDDPALAFQKVLGMSKYSIISLPYMWNEGNKFHKHHYIDEKVIYEWANKEPVDSFKVVSYNQKNRRNSCRIINLYKNF